MARSRPFRRPRSATRFAALAVAAVTLAACDTGDGKTLKPPAVAFTTTVAPTETLLSVPLVTAPITLPVDDLAPPTIDAGGLQAFQMFAPWQDGAAIDRRYTCDGDDLSPAVSWTSPPEGTSELAIALVDESATGGDGPFVHWVVVGIDPSEGSVRENEMPPGAVVGINSFGTPGYGGPCPPPGDDTHVYRLTLYALNQQSELADGTPANNLLVFIEDVAIGASSLTGTAQR